MKRPFRAAMTLALLSMVPSGPVFAAGLGGSMSSMRHQYSIARENDFTFLRTPAEVEEFVGKQRLERVVSDEVLHINEVSFPYARPAVALFLRRLSEQYYAATRERLVITSLTRPISEQPRNAHRLSVHPTGMAVDLRVPADTAARRWLENTLLSLERKGVLDVTREKSPPHYHVAVYPAKYEGYVATHPGDTIATQRLRLEASLALRKSPVEAADRRDSNRAVPFDAPEAQPRTPTLLAIAGFTGLLGAGALVRRRTRRSSRNEEPPIARAR